MKKLVLIFILAMFITSCVTRPYTIDDKHYIASKPSSWALSLVPGLTQIVNGEYLKGAILAVLFITQTTARLMYNTDSGFNDTILAWSILTYGYSYIDGVVSTYKMHDQKYKLENRTEASNQSMPNNSRSDNSNKDNLFIVKESSTDDIMGTIIDRKMTIYESNPNRENQYSVISFYLLNRRQDKMIGNAIGFIYVGSEWRFYDVVQLKIDERLFNLNVNSPFREVSGETVTEIAQILLPYDAVNALKSCKTIIIQINGKIRGTPITIAKDGIQKINNFFSE